MTMEARETTPINASPNRLALNKANFFRFPKAAEAGRKEKEVEVEI